MEIKNASGDHVAMTIETVGRGRTGRPVEVRVTAIWSAAAPAWRIWAGAIISAQVLFIVAGTVPPGSAVAIVALVPAALVDVRSRRLPDRFVGAAAAGLVAVVAVGGAFGGDLARGHVAVGAVMMSGPLLVLHLASPSSMGFGDVKAAAVLGAAAGVVHWQLAISALALAAGLSATVAVVTHARTIAFGPGLVSGAAIALALNEVFVP